MSKKQKRYMKIDPGTWTDARFLRLSAAKPNAQTLWLYLLSSPHRTGLPGLFRATPGAIGDDLGWSRGEVLRCMSELGEMARYDERSGIVWMRNAIAYNLPENPNVATFWGRLASELPDCALRNEAVTFLHNVLGEGYAEPFLKGFGNRLPNQEQEQEPKQEPEPEHEQEQVEQSPSALHPLATAWNELTSPPLGKCREVTKARRKHSDEALGRRPLEEWREVFTRIQASSYCRGEKNGWKANFDWAIRKAGAKPETALSVLEGAYDDTSPIRRDWAKGRVGAEEIDKTKLQKTGTLDGF